MAYPGVPQPRGGRRSGHTRRTIRESRDARRLPRPCSFLEQAFGEHDLHDARRRLRASPVALQLARERDPTDGLAAGLHDPLEAGAMRPARSTADRIDDGIYVVTLTQRVERRERHADLRPERAEDEFAPTG